MRRWSVQMIFIPRGLSQSNFHKIHDNWLLDEMMCNIGPCSCYVLILDEGQMNQYVSNPNHMSKETMDHHQLCNRNGKLLKAIHSGLLVCFSTNRLIKSYPVTPRAFILWIKLIKSEHSALQQIFKSIWKNNWYVDVDDATFRQEKNNSLSRPVDICW